MFQGFFMIELNSKEDYETKHFEDPDGYIKSKIMVCADAVQYFAIASKDVPYEFSSLRHAKYSTKELLYQLHCELRQENGLSMKQKCDHCHKEMRTAYRCPRPDCNKVS